MIIVVVPFMLVRRTKSDTGKAARFWNIFVLVSVIFLAYRSLIYTVYLPWIGQLLIGSSIAGFVHSLPLFRDVTAYPFQGSNPSTPLVFVANALSFVATSTIAGYFVLRLCWTKVKRQLLTIEELVFVSLFLPIPLTIAIYLPIGAFNLSYAILILPLLSAYCIWILAKDSSRFHSERGNGASRVKSGGALAVFLGAVIVSGGISYVGSFQAGTLLTNSKSDMNPGANWLFQHTSGRISILSDINTLGKALIARSLFLGGPFGNLSVRVYNPQLYADLIRPNYAESGLVGNSTSAPTYVVVDAITASPAASTDWLAFQPLSMHLSDIQGNAQLSQVYDDGTCLIEVWYSG